jgi:protoporphyrinogen oxidase
MRICVIGAGVTGLVAAYRLVQQGHDVVVLERWPGLGGQGATIDVGDGVLIERYYHHWFTSDRHVVDLHEELGVGDAIEWRESSVSMFAHGKQWPFTSPLDLLRYRPLPLWARIRMGLAVLRVQRSQTEVAPFEMHTARQWVSSAMGVPAWEEVWGPLLRAKFGDRADEISAAWLWGKLSLRRQTKGREARQELLGYPRGSFELMYTRLREEIEKRGGEVRIDEPAQRIERDLTVWSAAPGSFRKGLNPREFEPIRSEQYDAVIATVPSDVFLELVDDDVLDDDYTAKLRAAEYQTALCLLLEIDEQFSPFYWTNIAEADMPFIGLIEQANLLGLERYNGRRFLYVANYVTADDPLLKLSADELIEVYGEGLRRVNPRLAVKNRWLFQEAAAQPVVTVGYRDRIPALQTGVEGLILANTTQIYPEDRGTNYSVRLGDEAVAALTPITTS